MSTEIDPSTTRKLLPYFAWLLGIIVGSFLWLFVMVTSLIATDWIPSKNESTIFFMGYSSILIVFPVAALLAAATIYLSRRRSSSRNKILLHMAGILVVVMAFLIHGLFFTAVYNANGGAGV